MPPKKPAADPAPSSSDAPGNKNVSVAATLRKLAAHPSTAIMVKEALKELDSRKGVSSHAIQSYIKEKYQSVDMVRLKHFVRRALKKGLETGTLVRPANSNVAAGLSGRFRIAPKTKEAKQKAENVDPNMTKAPKAAKDGAKKPKKAGATKKKDSADEEATSNNEESKPAKKSKKKKEAAIEVPAETTSKAAPAKKLKAKKAAEKVDEEADDEDASDLAKATKKPTKEPKAAKEPKTAKETKATKEKKAGKVSEAAKAGSDAPAARATGKRGKKTAE